MDTENIIMHIESQPKRQDNEIMTTPSQSDAIMCCSKRAA